MGAMIAPILAQAKNISKNSEALPIRTATRSPLTTPQLTSAWAIRFTRWLKSRFVKIRSPSSVRKRPSG